MFLTPSFPLQSPAHFGLELKERRKNGAYKTCTCQYCPKMAHMFCTWDVVTTNCLMSISSFSKRSLCRLPYYSSCFLGRFSSSGPAGLPRPHLKPRGDLLGAVVCAFSGGRSELSSLCPQLQRTSKLCCNPPTHLGSGGCIVHAAPWSGV